MIAAAPSSRGQPRPALRLVLPDAKRERLERQVGGLPPVRQCSVAGCRAESMAVVLVEPELEAVLCPIHQLVSLEGMTVEGQPLLATALW